MKFTIPCLLTLICYIPNFVKIGPVVPEKMITFEMIIYINIKKKKNWTELLVILTTELHTINVHGWKQIKSGERGAMSIKYIKSYILIGQSWQKQTKNKKILIHPISIPCSDAYGTTTFIKSAESINSPIEPCYFSTSVLWLSYVKRSRRMRLHVWWAILLKHVGMTLQAHT